MTQEHFSDKDFHNERDRRNTEKFASLEKNMADLKELVMTKFQSMDVAMNKYESAQGDRDLKNNEFRQSLDDSNRLKVDRTEVDQRLTKMGEEIKELRIAGGQTLGKNQGIALVWVIGLSVIGATGTIIGIAINLSR